jgi:hypothetical protein
LNETLQLREVAQSGNLLYCPHGPMSAVDFALGGRAKGPADKPLERLKEHNKNENENCSGRFGRKNGLQPYTYSSNHAQVEKCEKCNRDGVDEIPLSPNLEKIMLLNVIDKRS